MLSISELVLNQYQSVMSENCSTMQFLKACTQGGCERVGDITRNDLQRFKFSGALSVSAAGAGAGSGGRRLPSATVVERVHNVLPGAMAK
jgi:hypothetical protein